MTSDKLLPCGCEPRLGWEPCPECWERIKQMDTAKSWSELVGNRVTPPDVQALVDAAKKFTHHWTPENCKAMEASILRFTTHSTDEE